MRRQATNNIFNHSYFCIINNVAEASEGHRVVLQYVNENVQNDWDKMGQWLQSSV